MAMAANGEAEVGWALGGAEHCSARVRRGREGRPEAGPVRAEGEMPTLEGEIARLAARRDRVDRWLGGRLEDCAPGEAVRYLVALAQVAKSLAGMLGQQEEGGGNELQRLLADAARRVRERGRDDSPQRREGAKETPRKGVS